MSFDEAMVRPLRWTIGVVLCAGILACAAETDTDTEPAAVAETTTTTTTAPTTTTVKPTTPTTEVDEWAQWRSGDGQAIMDYLATVVEDAHALSNASSSITDVRAVCRDAHSRYSEAAENPEILLAVLSYPGDASVAATGDASGYRWATLLDTVGEMWAECVELDIDGMTEAKSRFEALTVELTGEMAQHS